MSLLDALLLTALGTLIATLATVRTRWVGYVASLGLGLQLLVLFLLAPLGYGAPAVTSGLAWDLFGQPLVLRYDAMSWYFALITLGAGLVSSVYATGAWSDHYRAAGRSPGWLQFALALNVFTMLLLLASGDFLSLFIAWELVSWASFLLMALAAGPALKWSLRYITYATAGAMSMLAALGIVFHLTGSLNYADFMAAVDQWSVGLITLLTVLFGAGFAVKMGILPFHLWQAGAYAETPGPGMAFLGAISSRMGLYGMMLVWVQLIGLIRLIEVHIPLTFLSLRDVLMWIAAFTIILPTYTALKQNDARRLLAWHGIGQGGYMLMGILSASALGSAGGILHIFNYATNQAVLLLAVFAVVYRTGTADLNKLGGLFTRMPLTFVAMLVGIIGLAGIPPMNGFVSKWMVYRSLLSEGMPLLFVASVIGTLGTILSVYKLIHNTFLGQLRLEHEPVQEAPWSMVIPMMVLALIIFLTGFMPGIVLDWVAAVQAAVGLPVLPHTLGGVADAHGGLDMIMLVLVLFAGFGVSALLFYATGRSEPVHQLDNYAGGHFLSADVRYHYSDHFYAGLMHRIGHWYRGSFLWFESVVASLASFLAQWSATFYRLMQPALPMLAMAVIVLWMVS